MAASARNKVKSVLIVRSAFGEIHELAWLQGVCAILGYRSSSSIPTPISRRIWRAGWSSATCLAHISAKSTGWWLRAREQCGPDVVHFYQGHHYTAETIANVAQIAFASGSHCDDPFGRSDLREYRLLLKALPKYDGYHVNRECNLAEATALGAKRARVLMMYYIPWLHYPCSLTAQEKTDFGSDVVFAGHMEPDLRVECLSGVIRAGLKCRIFGGAEEWTSALDQDAYESVRPIFHARGADYRRALCASKIGAVFLQQMESRSVHYAVLGDSGLRSFSSF